MNNKLIAIIAAVIVVIVIAAAAVVVLNNDDDDDKVDVNAAKIANAFIANYNGDYDTDFSVVITDENNAKASAEVDGGMISEVYVAYSISDKASDLFDAEKATYEAKIKTGSSMGGLTYAAIEEKGSFDKAYGYSGDCNMVMGTQTVKFVSIHYAALYENVYVESVLYLYGSNYADHNFTEVVTAMYNAIQKPVDGTLEQKVTAFKDSTTETFSAEYIVSVDGNTAKAVTDGVGMLKNLGLVITQQTNESKAKEYFETQQTAYKANDNRSPMEGLTYHIIEQIGDVTGYGYYGDATGGVMGTWVSIHYSGYIGNLTFDATFYVDEVNYASVDFASEVSIILASVTL